METAINSMLVRGMVSFRQWSSQFPEKDRENLEGRINIDILNQKNTYMDR